jgi:hypothetical protein
MFVILAHQRSGTHLLASLLDSHPDLRCYGEVYLTHRHKMPLGIKNIKRLNENEGCILMYTHFIKESGKNIEFVDFISKAKIIHLTRNNIDKHIKSLFKKRNAEVEERRAALVKNLITNCRRRVFKNKFKNVFPITYEEICNDKNITEYRNDKLLKFLGVKPVKLTTKFRKGVDPYTLL